MIAQELAHEATEDAGIPLPTPDMDGDDLFRLADALAAQAVSHWVLQTCRGPASSRDVLDASDLAALALRFERFECR